jgi:glucokinase
MSSPPNVIDLSRCALFLDVDGTLFSLHSSTAVPRIDEELEALLSMLLTRTQGALALVSGRTIEMLDAIFAPLSLAAAGVHGAQLRFPGAPISLVPCSDLPEVLIADLQDFAARDDALELEHKPSGVVLHYRNAPDLEFMCRDYMLALVERHCPDVRIIEGKQMLELAPHGVNKGEAIRARMTLPPFVGRSPVFIGDDLSDEDGFRVVNAFGGLTIRVGLAPPVSQASCRLRDVHAVRRWLHQQVQVDPLPVVRADRHPVGEVIGVHLPVSPTVLADLHHRDVASRRILAGDVGHTKTLLGVFELAPDGWRSIRACSYRSRDLDSFASVVLDLLGPAPLAIDAACIGVAGPVIDGRCKPTDLDWMIDVHSLRSQLGTPKVRLVNDLVALGYGVDWLLPRDLVTVQAGETVSGNRVVLAAGSGLGESTLFWDGTTHQPSPSEGGHADFAPQNEWEIGLLRHLMQRFGGHVSVMRVVSGHGLNNMFKYIVSTGGRPDPELQAALAADPQQDLAPLIVRASHHGTCPISMEVIDRFLSVFGAESSNLALKSLAVGGVYLGGGVPPRIVEALTDGRFLTSFLSKGRFRWLLERVPVHVIMEPRTHLLGAIRYANSMLDSDLPALSRTWQP